jgi:hypothetical protein
MPTYSCFIEIPWSPEEAGQAENAALDDTSPAPARHWRDVEPVTICIPWSPESQGEAGQAKDAPLDNTSPAREVSRISEHWYWRYVPAHGSGESNLHQHKTISDTGTPTKLYGWDAEAEEEEEDEQLSLPVLEKDESEDDDEYLHQHQVNYVDDEMQEVEMQESLLHHSTTRCKNHSSTSYLSSPKAQRVLKYPACPPPEVQGIEPTQRGKKKLFPIQSRGVLGKFIPLPEHRERNATRVTDKKRAKPERVCSAEPSFQQPPERDNRPNPSSQGSDRITRSRVEYHAEAKSEQISSKKKVTLPRVCAKASRILGSDMKPAGFGLFIEEAAEKGTTVTEYGIAFLFFSV